MKLNTNESGVTLLYVIMALLSVSLMGVALANIASSDLKSTIYTGATESARLTSQNGFIHSITQLEVDKEEPFFDSLIEKLMTISNADSLEEIPSSSMWILGNDSTYLSIGSTEAKYRAQIEGFDKKSMSIALRVDAIGSGNSKSTNRGIYYLEGLELDTLRDTTQDTSYVPIAAMRLEQSNYNMNCSLVVHGDTYFGGKVTMNNKGKVFDGTYRAGNSPTDSTAYNSTARFMGAAYFGHKIKFNNTVTFEGNVGFETKVDYANDSYLPNFISGNLYCNGGMKGNGWSGKVNLNGGKTYGWGNDNTYQNSTNTATLGIDKFCTGYSYYEKRTTADPKYDLISLLGIDTLSSSFEIDTTELVSYVYRTVEPTSPGTQVDASILNNWYSTCIADGQDWNGFMVLRGLKGTMALCKPGSDVFTGKVIWIADSADLRDWYDAEPYSSNQLLYLRTSDKMSVNHGGFTNFRGLIYCDDINANAGFVSLVDDCHLYGAFYVAEGAYHAINNSGGPELLEITFDEAALNEFQDLGIIVNPNTSAINEIATVIGDTLILRPGYDHIETKLLSRLF